MISLGADVELNKILEPNIFSIISITESIKQFPGSIQDINDVILVHIYNLHDCNDELFHRDHNLISFNSIEGWLDGIIA